MATARALLTAALQYCGGFAAYAAEIVLDYEPITDQDARDCARYVAGKWAKMFDPLSYAARSGDLLLFKSAASGLRTRPSGGNIIRALVRNLGLLRWAFGEGYSLRLVQLHAAKADSVDVLRWAYAVGLCRHKDLACVQEKAAENGSLGALRWSFGQLGGFGDQQSGAKVCAFAAQRGDRAMLEWALSEGARWDHRTCDLAAQGGHFELLQWAHSKGCAMGADVCAGAIHHKNLAMLQWARSRGAPWGVNACTNAAQSGLLGVLQQARAEGCDWDESTALAAVEGEGDPLEILRWLHENSCPWDEGVCIAAAEHSDLEVLKWAREHGCPWSENVWEVAVAVCNPGDEMLLWLREVGCPGSEQLSADESADESGDDFEPSR